MEFMNIPLNCEIIFDDETNKQELMKSIFSNSSCNYQVSPNEEEFYENYYRNKYDRTNCLYIPKRRHLPGDEGETKRIN